MDDETRRRLSRAKGEQGDSGERGADEAGALGPPSGEVRIDALEASVALERQGEESPATANTEARPGAAPDPIEVFELPDWSEPATGQVPRVFLEDTDAEAAPALRGPTWRQSGEDWSEDEGDLFFLMEPDDDDRTQVAGRVDPVSAPFEFSFEELEHPTGEHAAAEPEAANEDAAWDELFEVPADAAERRRRRHARRPAGPQRRGRAPRAKTARAEPARDVATAVATGVVLAAVAIACFSLGSVTSLALVTAFLVLAAGEAFSTLRRAGHRPATLPGLLSVLALVVGSYLFGFAADPAVLAATVVVLGAWYLAGERRGAVAGFALTVFVVSWVGLLGAFSGLLLAPSLHPARHGVALLVGVVAVTVAYDVGAYAVGARLGSRHIAPLVSPNKTLEGLVGGTVLALLVGGLALPHLHPFRPAIGLLLGVLASVLAPFGDLVESLVKRDLGQKDMGRLLPGHGGILDRADAMLFVLPGAFYLARLFHVA